MMLTFKHFMDRPSWAAAAGYDFNIIDCLSYSAKRFGCTDVMDLLEDTGDIELRQVIWKLPVNILAMCILIAWPFVFWLQGILIYIRCRIVKKKYGGMNHPERVQINLRNWRENFDREQRRNAGKGKL